ncbi:hypothetical protein NC651_020570 [Populus alba x Populus x berolinensis]|nr:hypothetical protein NC651_020570 [Populus alba x Populus x berolinensis]
MLRFKLSYQGSNSEQTLIDKQSCFFFFFHFGNVLIECESDRITY